MGSVISDASVRAALSAFLFVCLGHAFAHVPIPFARLAAWFLPTFRGFQIRKVGERNRGRLRHRHLNVGRQIKPTGEKPPRSQILRHQQ
jgi:hypothetical protein